MKKPSNIRRLLAPTSLRMQLLARSLILMAVILAVVGSLQYIFMQEFIYQNRASSIQSQILALPPDAWSQMTGTAPDYGPNHRPFFFLPDSTMAFIDTSGNFSAVNSPIHAGIPPRLSVQDYQAAMQAGHRLNYQVVSDATGGKQLLVLQPIFSHGYIAGLIQVGVSTKPLQQVLIRQLLTFLGLSLLALAGGMVAFMPVLRKTLVPLSNMVETVEQIDAGKLDERFPVQQGQVEVDRLAISFNGMLERLEASFAAEKEAKEQMRRFVADASHELRTPLTSIHGFLEVLLRGAMHQPEMLQKSLKSMYAESERMKKLVQDLLLLAKLDRSPKIKLAEGELDALIEEMEPQLRLLAGTRQVNLRLDEHVTCRYDEDKLKQVLLNLFHNAVQHTDPEHGRIELALAAAGDGVELVVCDNGSGIGEEHLAHLFDRFYRSDSSRTRKYGGAGLGLAITKSIIELHGGNIRVESTPGTGSAFYVWLPA